MKIHIIIALLAGLRFTAAAGGQTVHVTPPETWTWQSVSPRVVDERLEQAMMDKRDTQFLYRDGDDYIFMDQSTYDQVPVSSKSLGDAANFLKETGKAMLILHDDEIIGVELPASVELTITETEPGIQGDRVSGARKSATLETGLVVQVPLFVGPGELIKVDTRTGEYMTRA